MADVLARRFLHVNLNCMALKVTEDLYVNLLGLSARMRTDPSVATDGSILGLSGETFCETAFLYDARGPSAGCALEVIHYRDPALSRDRSTDPSRPGIRATALAVPDLEKAIAALRAADFIVGEQVPGLIGLTDSVLVRDPDGAVIELSEAPTDANGTTFDGLRIAAIDLDATAAFMTAIGFTELQSPTKAHIRGDQLDPSGPSATTECHLARYALAEDCHQFTVTVVSHPDTRAHEPVPWGGNRQGLYRCALRVDSVDRALDALPAWLAPVGEPVWCPLPGTKIEGLYIAFLRSPDGVVFEFVERPLEYFTR